MEWHWKTLIPIAALLLTVQLVTCKPVNRPPPAPAIDDKEREAQKVEGTGLEYDRYLRQVVEALESDDDFRKKLEAANVSDIKNGAIAMHLQLVNRKVRTKLDELKRMEIMRLQQLARLKNRAANAGGKVDRMEIPGHLDLRNPHSFEIKDLENLILKTTKDLEDVDEKRRKDFKEYEMEKEYEYQQKLKDISEEERKRLQEQHEKLQQKHKEHEKIQHPGSKDQFEEVWEKDDKMEDQDFDPKTFFMMHDLNQDMYWDIQEVEAVLQRELEKMYDERNTPEEDDPVEKEEEMNRMREHVFKEIDQDKDLMISIQEFLQYTGKHGENKKFEENDGWETVDDKPAFTDEEYQDYIRQHHAQPGEVPPPVDNNLQFQPEEQLNQQQQQQVHQEQKNQQEMPQVVPQGVQQGGVGQPAQAGGGAAEQQEGQRQQAQPQEAHQPPQLQEAHQPPQPQEAHQPPQLQEAHQPPQPQEAHQPPQLQEAHQPPQPQEAHQPPQLQEAHQPPQPQEAHQAPQPQEAHQPPPQNQPQVVDQGQPIQGQGQPGENQPQQVQPDQGQPVHHQPPPPSQ